MKIVFFGTPEFAVASLDALIKDGADVRAVVTMPDKPIGRGHKMDCSDVKKFALDHGLPVLQPANLKDPGFIEELREIGADLFIVIAFRMLPKEVWGMPPLGTFNLHASLLPRYRGAAPINRAVMNGDIETGVTTFFLKHEIDTGDIIMQRSCPIARDDNAGDVHDRLMAMGAEMVCQTVRDLKNGNVKTIPQPEGKFIPAPKIFKETCRIDWNQPSEKIFNHIRGLAPYPAAWTEMTDDKGNISVLKIFKADILKGEPSLSLAPGEVKISKKSILAGTADGVIEIRQLQPAGKKRMDAEAFVLGYHPVKFA